VRKNEKLPVKTSPAKRCKMQLLPTPENMTKTTK